jgi:hypothetical protein
MHPASPRAAPAAPIPVIEVERPEIQLPAIQTAKDKPHNLSNAPMFNLVARASSQRTWDSLGTSVGLVVITGTAMNDQSAPRDRIFSPSS